MKVDWNDNVESQLSAMIARSKAVLDEVSREYSGRPIGEVREALEERWNGANEGASITDPELTAAATVISNGKRVWLEDDGRIMADD